MIQLAVLFALCVIVILTGAVLHFFMPESSMPTVIIALATATLVPAIVKLAKDLTESREAERKAKIEANAHARRADKLFEETTSLKRDMLRPPE